MEKTEKGLTYLATPYSHPDRSVRVARFEAVNRLAASLMSQGIHIYSPISHTHPIAEAGSLLLGWEFWEQYDRTVLSACSAVIVFRQPGWDVSKGVQSEIAIARELGLPVSFVDPGGGRMTPGEPTPATSS